MEGDVIFHDIHISMAILGSLIWKYWQLCSFWGMGRLFGLKIGEWDKKGLFTDPFRDFENQRNIPRFYLFLLEWFLIQFYTCENFEIQKKKKFPFWMFARLLCCVVFFLPKEKKLRTVFSVTEFWETKILNWKLITSFGFSSQRSSKSFRSGSQPQLPPQSAQYIFQMDKTR